MTRSELASRAAQFKALNEAGGLRLPNAWDGASARLFQAAGFSAVGTTSAGIAYARGMLDAEVISRDDMMREIAAIAAAVDVPVTADIEAGYGPSPADVAATVDATLDAGAVGINLEDNMNRPADATAADASPLFTIDQQSARIAAARAAAERRGIALVINARTDPFLMGLGANDEERLAMSIERGRAYLRAGADLVFIPVMVDPAHVRRAADAIGGPISVMALPGAPSADAWFAAGAARVSLGPLAMMAALGVIRDVAAEFRDSGMWTSIERTFYGFAETKALFTRD
jgi:2-methylisocitrate lyase-like PEP mutase family enzyme